MLSRDLLREAPDEVRSRLEDRGADPELIDEWLRVDVERRQALVEVEDLKRTRNEASKAIGAIKREGGDASAEIAQVGELKARIEELEERVSRADDDLRYVELRIPNLPDDEVPRGVDESANRVERVVGEPPSFDFEPKAHWDLGVDLGILDFERATKLAGARFALYRGLGARLERALASFMLDLHTGEHGYTEWIPPYITNDESLTTTTQLPKFATDQFRFENSPYWLIPTAEVPLTNIHRGEILDEEDLPLRYTAFTPCFRSEAGSYGRDVRGLIRNHQFHKVELVHITHPDASRESLERMTEHACRVLDRLEIAYRVVTLSRGDMGFGAARTYDIEVWLPAQGEYREISSCSNCRDFQARRGGIRFRPADGSRPRLVHTLNGSGLAVGRTFVAVLENYQDGDGSVRVPEALRPYLGGLERITAEP
ncbi:MAG: serine--tRNA ligase [Thermoanaerobaculia bacterium]|nr:serine--tRNA ligase [Thermoanaerobaculia bacterium]